MATDDLWICTWGGREFKAKKFYEYCFRNEQVDEAFGWIWKTRCTMQWKVFLWLLLVDRLNTRNILRRRHYKLDNDDYNCLLCQNPPEEDLIHLFFDCPFSARCWRTLGISWPNSNCRLHKVHVARAVWDKPMFLEIFTIAAWEIWKERNDKLFRNIPPSHATWLVRFKKDFSMMTHRAKQKFVPFIHSFLADL